MRKGLVILLSAVLTASCGGSGRVRQFNDGWVFSPDGSNERMEVTLPHDFALLPVAETDTVEHIGPFSRRSPGTHHTGHVLGGSGLYSKTFTLSRKDEGKRVSLLFDGSYMETVVSVNGRELGSNLNGYTPFSVDITEALLPAGQENVVEVRVDNEGRNSRWYTGSGLYREVSLVVTEPVHVDTWGVCVTTPEVSEDGAEVNVRVTVRNDSAEETETTVEISILDSKGSTVARAGRESLIVPAGSTAVADGVLSVSNPSLWSPDSPVLYTARVNLGSGDEYDQPFGIRSIEISAERGLMLNGAPTLLRGGCVHHDNGFLGAAAIERAERRRLEILKRSGFNAVRSSHNPPSQNFLNACDELGLLVIDEFTDMWDIPKNPGDYSRHFWDCWEDDLNRMMLRDRNHPSVIFWSIGNEIPKAGHAEGVRIGSMIRDRVRDLDPTRPVTEGVPSFLIHGGWEMAADYFEVLDVCGYNYMADHYESDHARWPERVMYASESYPKDAYMYWDAVERLPYVIGDFVWSAFDYIGEVAVADARYVKELSTRSMQSMNGIPMDTDPRRIFELMELFATDVWPKYISWCGDIDIIGQKKPQGLYRDVLWDVSVVEMNVHESVPDGMLEQLSPWGWPRELPKWSWDVAPGTPLQVRVFTKAPAVRLELNGKTIGECSRLEQYTAVFTVPYEPGTLTAVALGDDGSELGRKELTTPGQAVALRLTADRDVISSCPSDLSYVLIEAVDDEGRLVSDEELEVEISVSGDGYLAASGNASIDGMDSVNSSLLRLYNGQAQAVIRPDGHPGSVKITAVSSLGETGIRIKTGK